MKFNLVTAAVAVLFLTPFAAHADTPDANATPAADASADNASMGSSAGAVNPPASPAGDAAQPASAEQVTNGPVPDTAETRAKYPPLSMGGRHTKAANN